MLLSVINLTDTKSLEEVQDNFWKRQMFGTCRRLLVLAIATAVQHLIPLPSL